MHAVAVCDIDCTRLVYEDAGAAMQPCRKIFAVPLNAALILDSAPGMVQHMIQFV